MIIRTKYINLLGYNISGKNAYLCRYCKKWGPAGPKYELREEYCKETSSYFGKGKRYASENSSSLLRTHGGWPI